MIIKDKVIFITGASGGIGKCLVEEFLNRGAAKIYAADLKPTDSLNERVLPVKLDITSQGDINICAAFCSDVDILVNNAGVEIAAPINSDKSVKAAQLEMNVNCLGLHNLTVAFWESLKAKKEAYIINMLSIASYVYIPSISTYCASKVAAHSIAESFRHAAVDTNIKVVGIYPGYVDTNMVKDVEAEKITPQKLVINICNELENDVSYIFPDPMSKELSVLAANQYVLPTPPKPRL